MNRALVEKIERKVSLSPATREAFLTVDRGLFVPRYLRQQAGEWITVPADAHVYEDKALTTQVTNGLASSSSSQPSIMAAMLEALEIQPGQRVLEIGAGTGYNAGLLARLVGEQGQVTSIDIDPQLVHQAGIALEKAGMAGRVKLIVGDGQQGSGGCYDRIIVTAGFEQLAQVWADQLAPEGVLVGNWQGNLFSVLLCLKKGRDGITGHLLPAGASFMPIHGSDYPTIQAPNWEELDKSPSRTLAPEAEIIDALGNQAFLFFLERHVPHMQLHYRAYGTPAQFQVAQAFVLFNLSATIRTNEVVDRGCWDVIAELYNFYTECGKPGLPEYQITYRDGRLNAGPDCNAQYNI